ncbi:unnamed protein product [Linum tenue]|uniref:Disease resistance RPP13-like protein 1 n=1 Tax=Linum tenue TaxID=586396 RepID=A0AAV0HNC5_9ROSI|nr:unnamed protein product [Linum tenue]
MAAAVVGGSFLSAFLQVLFDRMASPHFLGFCKRQNLNDKLLRKLKTLLNSVNGVLDDAEEKQIIKPSVEKWLNELKDAVYEADDLLDEIGYEALRSEAESESESAAQTNPRKVWNLLASYNPFQKGSEEKLKDVIERLQDLVSQLDALGLREHDAREASGRIPTTSLVQECDVYGRDADKEAIVDRLISDDPRSGDLEVVLIVGMGGIGKTTLAQLVYNDERIKDRFGYQAWVCVSEEYDVFRVTKDVIEEVTRQACDIRTFNQLQLELKRILKGQRFLLVLDDVWIDEDGKWDMLQMPFKSGAKGSKVIVTTRNQNVASVMGTRSIYHLNQLDNDDCWLLFSRHAFGDADEFADHPHLEVVGREVVRKCKGIPLAAKTLGGLLHSERDVYKWEKVLNSNLWDLSSNKILPALKLSYYYLPSHLKRCFAYCALFPEDYEFRKDELVLLWMAKGFLIQPGGHSNFEEIVNLHYLNNGETKLKEMPSQMGKLSNLRKLTDFVLGKGSGSTIKELGQLHYLHESLTIWNLQFVNDVRDASLANLKGKKYLKLLKFVWNSNTDDSVHERVVLEQLQPTTNLESLSIIGYGGTRFADWLGHFSFSTMASIELRGCKHCSSLPPLGQLGSLKNLSIVAFDAVLAVGPEFYGSSPMGKKSFGSLKTLLFEKMENWQEWNSAGRIGSGAFPVLEQLYIKDCPNLSKAMPSKLPCLETLVIEGCQQLNMATIPSDRATYCMHLVDDHRDVWLNRFATIRPQHLQVVRFFCHHPPRQSLELVNGLSTALEEIEICRSNSLTHFPLHAFPKLKMLSLRYCDSLESLLELTDSTINSDASSLDSLEVSNCPNLVSFPKGGLLAPNLTQLLLQSCLKLKSLPEKMHSLIPSLLLLRLTDCPELESFPEGGLPSKLQSLEIYDCSKLIAWRRNWKLQSLPALLHLYIGSDIAMESFPHDEAMLPPTLTSLEISDLQNLKSLDTRCFRHLTSLERLKIKNCPELEFIPNEKLPSSLRLLSIIMCPLLRLRCQQEKGELWPMISHIRDIFVY